MKNLRNMLVKMAVVLRRDTSSADPYRRTNLDR